jgi:hypothetical protein
MGLADCLAAAFARLTTSSAEYDTNLMPAGIVLSTGTALPGCATAVLIGRDAHACVAFAGDVKWILGENAGAMGLDSLKQGVDFGSSGPAGDDCGFVAIITALAHVCVFVRVRVCLCLSAHAARQARQRISNRFELTFMPVRDDKINFKYVFASREMPEYAHSAHVPSICIYAS